MLDEYTLLDFLRCQTTGHRQSTLYHSNIKAITNDAHRAKPTFQDVNKWVISSLPLDIRTFVINQTQNLTGVARNQILSGNQMLLSSIVLPHYISIASSAAIAYYYGDDIGSVILLQGEIQKVMLLHSIFRGANVKDKVHATLSYVNKILSEKILPGDAWSYALNNTNKNYMDGNFSNRYNNTTRGRGRNFTSRGRGRGYNNNNNVRSNNGNIQNNNNTNSNKKRNNGNFNNNNHDAGANNSHYCTGRDCKYFGCPLKAFYTASNAL